MPDGLPAEYLVTNYNIPQSVDERRKGVEHLGHFLELIFHGHPFDTEKERLDLLAELTPESFIKILEAINAAVRELPKGNELRGIKNLYITAVRSGDGLSFTTWRPPYSDDKIGILSEALQSVQVNLDLEDAIARLPDAVIWTHPFSDGNGRVAMTVEWLLKNGFTKAKVPELVDYITEHKYGPNLSFERFQQDFAELFCSSFPALKDEVEGLPTAMSDLSDIENEPECREILGRRGLSEDSIDFLLGASEDSFGLALGIISWLNYYPERIEDLMTFVRSKAKLLDDEGNVIDVKYTSEVNYGDKQSKYRLNLMDFSIDSPLVESLSDMDVLKLSAHYWGIKSALVRYYLHLMQGQNVLSS